MTRKNSAASEAEAAAQTRLKKCMEKLKDVDKEMREIHKSLDPPEGARTGAAAGSEVDEEENDISTEIRSVIECVLTDSLGPAIRDLQAVVRYGTKRSSGV